MIGAWPFVVQGLVLIVDEFWCHHRRGLDRWERRGHPIDTASFVLCLAWTLLAEPNRTTLGVYAGLTLASCLIVTKDEWEHAGKCDGFENWLHALLFMMHPTLLIWAGHLWWSGDPGLTLVNGGAAALAAGFLSYQLVYWNWWRTP